MAQKEVGSPILDFDVPHYDFTSKAVDNSLNVSKWFDKEDTTIGSKENNVNYHEKAEHLSLRSRQPLHKPRQAAMPNVTPPLMERIKKFNETPARYHTRSHKVEFRARSDSPQRPRDTRPKSPKLATRERAEQRQSHSRKRSASRPHDEGRAVQVRRMNLEYMQRPATKPRPFAFEAREVARQAATAAKQEQAAREAEQLERAQKQFHAQPLPDHESGPKGVPPRQPQPPTKFREFHLRTDELAAREEAKRLQMLKETEAEMRIARQFRAASPEVLRRDPFIAVPSTRSVTIPESPALATARRPVDEERVSVRQRVMREEHRLERQHEETAAELAIRLEARRAAESFKAHEPRQYKPVARPESTAITLPKSPKFSTRFKK